MYNDHILIPSTNGKRTPCDWPHKLRGDVIRSFLCKNILYVLCSKTLKPHQVVLGLQATDSFKDHYP